MQENWDCQDKDFLSISKSRIPINFHNRTEMTSKLISLFPNRPLQSI